MNDTLSHWHCACVCAYECVFGSDITPHYLWNEGLHFLIQWSLWLEWKFMTTRISFTYHKLSLYPLSFSPSVSLPLSSFRWVSISINETKLQAWRERLSLAVLEFNGLKEIVLAPFIRTAQPLGVNYRLLFYINLCVDDFSCRLCLHSVWITK